MGSESYKILLIEDNPDDFFLIQEVLDIKGYNFRFIHVETLQKGLKLLDEDDFDIILLDLGLPDSEGFPTFTQVYTHAQDVPIIILTGLHDEKMGVKAVREGAQDYLVKGQVDSDLMSRAIKYAIERKNTENALNEEKKFIDIALDAQTDTFFVFEIATGRAIRWNSAFRKLSGYTDGEISVLKAPDSYYGPEDLKNAADAIKTLMHQKTVTLELSLITKDGKTIPTEYNASIIRDSKNIPQYIIAVGRDINERKIAEEQVKQSLKEKEMLLKEIHHRVKNNLMIISSLLNLQSRYIKDKKSIDIFKESQNRARSMALIHERLYQSTDLKRIDFGDYIRTLSSELYRTFVADSGIIKLKINVEDIFLDINTAIPLGLIVNELITNSFKHAFPDGRKGGVTVDFHSEIKKSVLIVSDDGVGFPKDLDFRNTDSLGLQLVNSLTDQIDAEIELDSSRGTKFTVKFRELKI